MKKVFLGLMLLGFGSIAFAQQKEVVKSTEKSTWEIKQEGKMDKMQKELGLSDQQKSEINALFIANKKRSDDYKAATTNEERVKLMLEIKEEGANFNEHIKAILSPEQYQKYRDLRKKEMGSFGNARTTETDKSSN